MENKDVFKAVHDVVFGTTSNPVWVYYPYDKKIEWVGLSIRSNLTLEVDHLPRTGYSFSSFLPDEYGEKILVFRKNIYPFEKTMFLDSQKEYTIFHLQDCTASKARVALIPNGVGINYILTYANGDQVQHSREDYGESFVIIEE